MKLLRQFYKKILIPPAVWKEVVEEGQSRPGAREVEEGHRSGWIAVSAPLCRLRQTGDGRSKTGPPSSVSGLPSPSSGQPSTDRFIWALKDVSFHLEPEISLVDEVLAV